MEKLLGVSFVSKLTFHAHIGEIRKKSGLKLSGLATITPYMDFNKKQLF